MGRHVAIKSNSKDDLNSQKVGVRLISCIFENAMKSRSRLGDSYRYITQNYDVKQCHIIMVRQCRKEVVDTGCFIRDLVSMRDSHNGSLDKRECEAIIEYVCPVT